MNTQIRFDFKEELQMTHLRGEEGIKENTLVSTNVTDIQDKELHTPKLQNISSFDLEKELGEDVINNDECDTHYIDNRELYKKDLGVVDRKSLTLQEEQEYFRKIRNGDMKAREEFINLNLKLVVFIAKRYSSDTTAFSKLDIIQEGNIGLMTAVDKFDPSRGFKFSTYAAQWINQSIKRALEEKSRMVKIPSHRVQQIHKIEKFVEEFSNDNGRQPTTEEIASALNCKTISIVKAMDCDKSVSSINVNYTDDKETELGDILSDGYSIEGSLVNKENMKYLAEGLKLLSSKEKEVISLRFFKNYKISQIERLLGVTRNEVTKTLNQALSKLKSQFKKKVS